MRSIPLSIGPIHFIGIGGIGMSGIAETLHNLGYRVQGSDQAESATAARLCELGIPVFQGHDPENLGTAEVAVISSAIRPDNAELTEARRRGLPVVRRADMLGELMRLKWAVAIAGTHGKTTTTSLVGALLEAGGYDPTVINGGIINAYGANTRRGESDWMVVEADESDGTFTRLPATISVVTNIDPEHMEYYGDYEALKDAFATFVENIPFYGFAVMCADHPGVLSLLPRLTDRRVLTYGFSAQADLRAIEIRSEKGRQIFSLQASPRLQDKIGAGIRDLELPMFGRHNIENALAAILVAAEIGITPDQIRTGLAGFSGVKRRFTQTGVVNNVTVIDDYGHHPVEIGAVLQAARQAVEAEGGRILAVMQPHRYSRLHDLFESFCTCFQEADSVIVADVYPAGEDPIEGANRSCLAQGIRNHGHRDVHEISGPEELPGCIHALARPGDYVVCFGAGSITKWAQALPGQLEQLYAENAA